MGIEKIVHADALEVKKLLKNSTSIVNTNRLLPEILGHIDKEDSLALKLVDDGKIVGVWLSKEFDKYVSLSYFFIAEEIRKRMAVYVFFMGARNLTNIHKPLLIQTNDISGFERYVEPFDEDKNIYVFRGLRHGKSS